MNNPLLLAIPFALLACNPTPNSKAPIEDRQLSNGRISIPLVSTSSSGATYILHLPSVTLESANTHLELSFEQDEAFDVSLQEGDYTLSIQNWTLYRLDGEEAIPVNAELISENPQPITIQGGETTHTTLRLRTLGDDVEFNNGHLHVDIEIEEDTAPTEPVSVECGEEIHNGSITFTEQDELDAFRLQYGSVNGDLTLLGAHIEDASALSCLRSTSLIVQDTAIEQLIVAEQEALHRLTVSDNPQLAILDVPVAEIGHLNVSQNAQLGFFHSLHHSSHGFVVEGNPALQELLMPNLSDVISDVYVQENDSLQHANLTSLSYVGNRIRVVDNSALLNLNLESLQMTGGYVLISENDRLESIAMPELFVVGDPTHGGSTSAGLGLMDNDSLTELDLSELFFVSRNLTISNNAQLETLDGFGQLTSINDLTIQGNARLHDVLGLATLTDLNQLTIAFNPHLPETMVSYLYDVEIGSGAVHGSVHIGNNNPTSLVEYGTSSCSADYLAAESGDLFPVGSTLHLSTSADTCEAQDVLADGSVWTMSGDCMCN